MTPRHEPDQIGAYLDAAQRIEQSHHEIIDAIARLEERLERHMTEEHREFREMVEVWKKAKGGALFLKWFAGFVIGGVAAAAGAYSFLKDNFHITLK